MTRYDLEQFDDRRRVLIGIAVATGLLCLVAAASAYLSLGAGAATIGLVVAAGSAFGFAALLVLGRGDWLTDDDQLLWLSQRDGEQGPRQ